MDEASEFTHDPLRDPLLERAPLVDGQKYLDPVLIERLLGKGGMGAVYAGQHRNLHIAVALKVLRPSLAMEGREFVERFAREARVAASIKSDHLVRVLDVRSDYGLHWIVMEYVDGETFSQRVHRRGRRSLEEALDLIEGAAKGLAAAHKAGVVHRDIKPGNLMIDHDGTVKVADLGLARAPRRAGDLVTATNAIMGTPQYMAPEQFKDFKGVGPAADIWALGATLWYLLTGQSGIDAESWTEVMQRVVLEGFPDPAILDVPEPVRVLIRKSTARQVADRLSDGAAFFGDRYRESFSAPRWCTRPGDVSSPREVDGTTR